MPMLPYPPPTKPGAAENSLLRVLGGVLALLSIVLTLLSIILHQSVLDLILAFIIGIFALRVLILWLGDKPQQQQSLPAWSYMDPAMHPMQSYPYTQGQSAPYASSYPQSQPPYNIVTEQHMQQTINIPPTEVAPPSRLPRSIRPQQPPNASAFPAQPTPTPQIVQPTSLWPTPPYVSVPMPSPAPLDWPSQDRGWQYDDGENFTQRQRGDDNGSA
jgi:hypothetical protein